MRSWQQTAGLTCCAMLAFAGNSILCRLALRSREIDPGSFTAIRLLSGAVVLAPLLLAKPSAKLGASSWASALALFVYAAAFSFAYVRLPASVGALVLFGTVQLTMVGIGLRQGQHLRSRQAVGFGLSLAGLLALTLPDASAPDPLGVALMAAAGAAWGVYSVRGGRGDDPLSATAGNFLRSLPLVALLAVATHAISYARADGVWLAIASGAAASGIGYIVWYAALRGLRPLDAALVQLSVPVITAAAGIVFLDESLTLHVGLAGFAILSGIAVAVTRK